MAFCHLEIMSAYLFIDFNLGAPSQGAGGTLGSVLGERRADGDGPGF